MTQGSLPLLEVRQISVKRASRPVLREISFTVGNGEQWAVTGAAGSGKTTLLLALAGQLFHSGTVTLAEGKSMVLVAQQHRFRNRSHTSDFYYQQRFNSFDSEDAETVGSYLHAYVAAWKGEEAGASAVLSLLDVHRLWERPLIQLSNGENKRVQLAQALLLQPGVLLLDNPFTGLDAAARVVLLDLLHTITQQGVQLLVVAPAAHLPRFITHVLQLHEGGGATASLRQDWQPEVEEESAIDTALLRSILQRGEAASFAYAVRMNGVGVRYGEKVILEGVDWTVKKGGHWLLSGPNGSGKSTLLSLITGDNPQAYSNEIYLFDQRRGRGESIWDIKKKIGYVSPELHLYFDPSVTAFEAIGSGYFDTIGLFRILSQEQEEGIVSWMQLLGIHSLAHKVLTQLSAGEQRLVLLARALVKNPPLLILDEPAQGLDEACSRHFRLLVDAICAHSDTTLIYVSHVPEEVPRCVQQVIRLEGGRVVEQGAWRSSADSC